MPIKNITMILVFSIITQAAYSQSAKADISKPDPSIKVQTVELSCGQCNFHLKGKGCDLAVRINNKAYFIDGADIDSFGDAHANDGFCNAIRKAEAQGTIVKNRFRVKYLKLLPPKS